MGLDLENTVAHRVEEVAVVADHHNGPGIDLQIIFQPFHGGKIQVVRGLVQNQQIGLLQQQLGQAQARVLAPGQHGHAFAVSLGREGHAVQDLFDLRVHVVAVGRVNDGLQGRVALHQGIVARGGGHLGLHPLHFGHGVQHRAKGVLHLAVNGAAGVQHAVLFQIPHHRAPGEGQFAAVGLVLPGDALDQRGLARAVLADDAHPVLAVQDEADILQAHLGAKIFFQVLYGQ